MRKIFFLITAMITINTGYGQSDINIEMVFVKGGTFMTGYSSEQEDEFDNTPSIHEQEIQIADFYIGKYKITQAQWKAVMGSNPSSFEGDSLAVETVNWDDIQEFIRKLNIKTGKNFRLPTEYEWEYAARDGKSYEYDGNNIADNAGYSDNLEENTVPAPLEGTRWVNGLGIYDMCGIFEWCADCCDCEKYNTDTEYMYRVVCDYRIITGIVYADALENEHELCGFILSCWSSDTQREDLGFRLVSDSRRLHTVKHNASQSSQQKRFVSCRRQATRNIPRIHAGSTALHADTEYI